MMKKLIGLVCVVVFSIAVAGCSTHGKPTSAANAANSAAAVSQGAGGAY